MLELLRLAVLLLALLTTGIMTGVFILYSDTIMPALARTDDKTFVASFQAMDRAILNPRFLATFMGALLTTALSALLSFGLPPLRPWTVAAFLLYLGIFVITMRVNVPLNNALKAAGDPKTIDVTAARKAFNENRWTRWNHIRSAACFLAFACLAWASILYGRLGE